MKGGRIEGIEKSALLFLAVADLFSFSFLLHSSLGFGEELKGAGCRKEELVTFEASLSRCHCCLFRTKQIVTKKLFFPPSNKDSLT
jgi:hypothetical protein